MNFVHFGGSDGQSRKESRSMIYLACSSEGNACLGEQSRPLVPACLHKHPAAIFELNAQGPESRSALSSATDAPCNRPPPRLVANPPMLAPSRARAVAPSSVVTLPSFLVPAFQNCAPAPAARRQFSASTARPSKLGRTPISIPPGVELTIGEPYIVRDFTTYKQTPRRTVTVTGPLGMSRGRGTSPAPQLRVWTRTTR